MSPFTVSAVEGAFVCPPDIHGGNPSMRPYTTMTAGGAALRCADGGVALARFAWASVAGLVENTRASLQDRLGFVILPFFNPALLTWQRIYWDVTTHTHRLRAGTECTLLTRGAVWARFADGSNAGDPVYARLVDGAPLSGYSVDGELTRWSVVQTVEAGGLAIITTSAQWSTAQ